MNKTISSVLLTTLLALGMSTAAIASPETDDAICKLANGTVSGQCTEEETQRLAAASKIFGPGRTIYQIDDWSSVRNQYCNQCPDSGSESTKKPIITVPSNPDEPPQDVPEPAIILSLLTLVSVAGLGLKRRV